MENILKVIPIIDKISEVQHPGKKTLQKIIYLMERKGINLGFDYSIHYYGPYSSNLDQAIHRLEMQGAIKIVTDGMSHRIHTTDMANLLLGEEESKPFNADENEIVEDIIETFGKWSGYDLELIATTDYVAGQIFRDGQLKNKDEVIAGVKRIKGDKFPPEKIQEAVENLESMGLLVTK